jgi:hypothetical protein
MNFVTKSVTTYFLELLAFKIHILKSVFLPLLIVEGDYIWGLLSPKHIQYIEIIIERACFYSGDKSGDRF